ncbi:MAG: hypothetical protein ACOC0A_03015, partial [Planctomycetota bacterium]
MSAPVLVKVLCSLGLILLYNAFFHQLALGIGIGALTLGIWNGFSFHDMFGLAFNQIGTVNTVGLLLIVVQVIALSSQMSRTGLMDDLVEAVKSRVSREEAMGIL